MTRPILDTHLQLPDPPGQVPRLGLAPAGLELSTSTGDSPFLIGGDRVTVTGPQRAPVAAVVIDGRLAATGVSASLGRPANFAVAPGRLRREWVGASGSSMETIIASPTLPLAAIQWARPEGAPLVVSLTLLPGTEPLLYHAVGGSIIAIRPDAPDQQVLITLCPLGGEWSVEEVTGGGLHITTQMDGAEPVTLLVTAGSHGDLAAALKAAPHLEAHERLSADYRPEGGLTVSSGVGELDEGIAWARARLAAGLSGSSTDGAQDAGSVLWSGIGALAAGDTRSARHAISAIIDPAAWPYAALLAGRLAMLTGEPGPALRSVEAVSTEDALPGTGTPEGRSLARVALRTLSDGLRHSASEGVIAELRRSEAELPTLGHSRRLPTVGTKRVAPDLGTWLESALAGSGGAPVPLVAGVPPIISAWGQSGSDPDGAWIAWRAELSRGLRDGAMGPGSWDTWTPGDIGTPIAGAILATLIHGFLGVAPDAPVGRIRIGPRFPRHLTGLRVSGLMIADAEIALSYERNESSHSFTLEPQRARVPPVVVFQPELPGRITRIRIDGTKADLHISSVDGGRSRMDVQIPVDTHRTVEIETE